MMPREAVALTGYLQAHFPQQPVSEYTPDALCELLQPYSLEDCKAAVLALATRVHGSESTRWCSPTDIYAEVRRSRARRIDDEVIPMPRGLDPDRTGDYIAALVGGRKEAAAGRTFEAPTVGTRDVVRELESAGMRVNVIPADETKAHRDSLRAAVAAGREQFQAAVKREPEPLLEPGDHSREPTHTHAAPTEGRDETANPKTEETA